MSIESMIEHKLAKIEVYRSQEEARKKRLDAEITRKRVMVETFDQASYRHRPELSSEVLRIIELIPGISKTALTHVVCGRKQDILSCVSREIEAGVIKCMLTITSGISGQSIYKDGLYMMSYDQEIERTT